MFGDDLVASLSLNTDVNKSLDVAGTALHDRAKPSWPGYWWRVGSANERECRSAVAVCLKETVHLRKLQFFEKF